VDEDGRFDRWAPVDEQFVIRTGPTYGTSAILDASTCRAPQK
jgi:hypothetical protein